jgi:hypothetical protein
LYIQDVNKFFIALTLFIRTFFVGLSWLFGFSTIGSRGRGYTRGISDTSSIGRGYTSSRGRGYTSSRGRGYTSSRGRGYTSSRGRGGFKKAENPPSLRISSVSFHRISSVSSISSLRRHII